MDPVLVDYWAIRLMFVMPLLIASYTDITSYRIPNWLCLAMLLLFPAAQWLAPQPAPWVPHLLTGALLLGVGLILFIPGLFGGGDAKLMAVCGLWLGPTITPAALMLTALTGGVLAVLLMGLRTLSIPGNNIAVLRKGGPIPYGLAIAAAGLLLSGQLSMLPP